MERNRVCIYCYKKFPDRFGVKQNASYCSDSCRQKAWRFRKWLNSADAVAQSKGPRTSLFYEEVSND